MEQLEIEVDKTIGKVVYFRSNFYNRVRKKVARQFFPRIRFLLFLVVFFGNTLLASGRVPGVDPDPDAVAVADDSRITDIRFWQSPEEAQIVIDMSSAPKVTPLGTLSDGTVFFDIQGCGFRPGHQRYPLNNSFVQVLNVQARSGGAVRIFFRPGNGVTQRTFVLPKSQVKSDRIVIFLNEPAQIQMQRRELEQAEIRRLKAGNVKIVVLDPGHGGEDPGARGNGIIEKNYVLAIGQMVKSLFDRNPKYRAFLTRSGDYIIPLVRRRQIAEQVGADLFVSIHANFNSTRRIAGVEVYFESPKGAVGEAERLVAESENQQDSIGGVGAPSTASIAKRQILQKQAEIMFKSRQLAERAEFRLARAIPGLTSRGVKRAGFRVLHSLAMPSILVELGYISNSFDAQVLRDPNGQVRLAQAVYQGIVDFLENQVFKGVDPSYFQYVSQVEAAKKAQKERVRNARARRERLLRNSHIYKVRKGDSLATVAAKFKATKALVMDLNHFGKNRKLKAGESIRVPGS